MHQTIRQLARIGKQQEPGTIDVQTPYRDPPARIWRRQGIEHTGTALRITMTADFSFRLVVGQHPYAVGLLPGKGAAIESHLIPGLEAHSLRCHLAVDLHTPLLNPAFNFPPGTKP
ncbi:MAG: hypothetical protein OXB92_17170, partial [Acidimicrobiaceae bacterium]|nr:hypothetical protein [Acidimicrobiaceae bacterium]